MKKSAWIWIVCCCAFVQKMYSQNFPDFKFALLAPFNNLPAGLVTTVYKDRQGLMWIGSENNGLLRFDGKKVKSYHSTGNNPGGIPSNFIGRICEDKQGCLWISALPGLYRLNPVTEEIQVYLHNDNDSNSIATNNKPMPYVDSKGRVWVASNKGLQQFNPATKKFIKYATPEIKNPAWQLHAKGVAIIYEDRANRIWAGSAYGLYLVDTTKQMCIPYFTGTYSYVSGIVQDYQGQLWVSFWGGGIKKFYPETGSYTDFFKPNSVVRYINEWEDAQHKKWICFAEEYFTLMDPLTGAYRYYKNDNIASVINGASINNIYKDNEERIWIMTNKGINIMDPRLQLFKNSSLQPAIQKFNLPIINTGIPNAFLKTPDSYLVSGWANGYLYKLNSSWQVTEVIKKLSPLASSAYPGINSMQYDDAGNTWFGTDSGLVKQSNKKTRYFIPRDTFSQLENRYKANEIIKRTDGLFWSRFVSRGVYIFDAQAGRFYKNYRGQYSGNTTCMKYDRKGTLWLGTSGGVYFYNEQTDSFNLVPLYKNKTVYNEFYHSVNDIYFDEQNIAWIATYYGLVRLSVKDKQVTFITDSQKPPHYSAGKILQDSTGIIWILSDDGIHTYNTRTSTFRYFSVSDGLPGDYTGGSNMLAWANDSTIATGYLNNIITFNPYRLNSNVTAAKLIFTDISIDDKRYIAAGKADETITITAPAGSKKISIHFALPNYTAPQQNRLYYKLANGNNSNWIETKDGDINLLDLSDGEYQLKVKAISNESIINEAYSTCTIIIRPYWYQTSLWKACSMLLLIAILYLLIRWRIKSIKKAAALKQQVIETEIAALKAQMNPHFIFNCINSIDAFIHSNDKYNATLYLNRFARLLRNILDSSKQNTVPFSKDIETLRLYLELEELRHENKFTTNINIETGLLENDYKVPPLIVQPFVENAILHGLKNRDDEAGILDINISKSGNSIQYIITDNGIGRAAAAQQIQNKESHYGMQMSYDRIKLFNKEKTASVHIDDLYEGEKATGTRVTFKINIT